MKRIYPEKTTGLELMQEFYQSIYPAVRKHGIWLRILTSVFVVVTAAVVLGGVVSLVYFGPPDKPFTVLLYLLGWLFIPSPLVMYGGIAAARILAGCFFGRGIDATKNAKDFNWHMDRIVQDLGIVGEYSLYKKGGIPSQPSTKYEMESLNTDLSYFTVTPRNPEFDRFHIAFDKAEVQLWQGTIPQFRSSNFLGGLYGDLSDYAVVQDLDEKNKKQPKAKRTSAPSKPKSSKPVTGIPKQPKINNRLNK